MKNEKLPYMRIGDWEVFIAPKSMVFGDKDENIELKKQLTEAQEKIKQLEKT